ncbi:DUF2878 domain-containing protein [Burkholderia glumae]|uniref:DUF2878 domain-containing protein n=1 Tax=Burkholderia glumae TaxID=337 RepID=UPI0020374920|nr:DUF2878 domain-containing protein [Burkholderia glumae]MCM2552538.1 DUF2878 domain-containing protein [Burkholderia glumae]
MPAESRVSRAGRAGTGAETAVYAGLSQGGWLVCVSSAAHGYGWLGMLCAALLAGAHLLHARARAREAALIAIVAVLGWGWEAVPAATGVLRYPNGIVLGGTAPYWMAGLWMLFAAQLNTLFRWLRGRWLTAALIGAAAGPLSFRAGAALGAVQFSGPAAWLLLGCGWAALLPAAVWLGARLEGTRHAS